MVSEIAKVYGFQISMGDANLLLSGLMAGSMALKAVATEASTYIPVLGWWVAKPSIATAACKAIGEAAIRYFEDKLREQPLEDKGEVLSGE